MTLANFLQKVDELQSEASAAIAAVADSDQLEAVRVRFLGAKNGLLKEVEKLLGSIEVSDKRAAGMRLNEVKQGLNSPSILPRNRFSAARLSAVGRFPIRRCRARRCRWDTCTR